MMFHVLEDGNGPHDVHPDPHGPGEVLEFSMFGDFEPFLKDCRYR